MRNFSSNETQLQNYLRNVKVANTELAKKELLKDLLVRLFGDDKKASEIIDNMSLGAERTILNIPLPERTKKGSADTQYGKVIIEFEKDLKKTGKHAEEQLAEYLAGNWKSGDEYNFTLIASDCIKWIIYSPTTESIIFRDKKLNAEDIEMDEIDLFELTYQNLDYFPYFLDRYLFKTEK